MIVIGSTFPGGDDHGGRLHRVPNDTNSEAVRLGVPQAVKALVHRAPSFFWVIRCAIGTFGQFSAGLSVVWRSTISRASLFAVLTETDESWVDYWKGEGVNYRQERCLHLLRRAREAVLLAVSQLMVVPVGGRGEPYKFLDPYEASDHDQFVARDREAQTLVADVISSRLVVICENGYRQNFPDKGWRTAAA